MTKRRIKEVNMEVKYVVHLDSQAIIESDWSPASEEQFEAMCQTLENYKILHHFSVVREGVDLFINPTKIEYIEVHTRDLDDPEDNPNPTP